MTFKPDQIGDKGQRYEIRAITNEGKEFRIGWADDPEAYAYTVNQHPGLKERIVVDREAASREGK